MSASTVPRGVTDFRISTAQPGVHRVRYDDLAQAGLATPELESATLALFNLGEPVPLWVDDGGDGRFGPGDQLEFVAERLPGTNSYFHEFSTVNVYQLRTAGAVAARRMTRATGERLAASAVSQPLGWKGRLHLEQDRLLIRLSAEDVGDVEEPELWFWEKLTHIDREPLEIPLELPGLAASSDAPISMAVHFRALSSQPKDADTGLADHRVEVDLPGGRRESIEWSGKTKHLAQLAPLSADSLGNGGQILSLSVPRRLPSGATDPLVDVVMLNWLEAEYPHDGSIGNEQVRLELAAPSFPSGNGPLGDADLQTRVRLTASDEGALVAYGDGGRRLELPGPGLERGFEPAAGESSYWLAPEGSLLSPASIDLDQPSALRAESNHADYLIVAHGSLLAATTVLADYHRSQGLQVALVDVQDIYDEFGHGIVHPQAIKDFIAHAYHHWTPPRPRYVLLVGDASWDTKNATVDDARYANWADRQLLAPGGFLAKQVPVYDADNPLNDRNLIPTHNFHTYEGHAASDNWFVTVDGDDFLPDLAIGRLPVADDATLAGIVAKTIRYASRPEVGPWRRRVLWIANEWVYLQDHSSSIEEDVVRPRGLASTRVFPSSQEETNEHHQAFVTDAFNDGQLLVHFAGHGGRFIWRTGPPDLGAKNHDLFTLDHLDALAPNERLPVVFSITCHTGPFDHPNADSIAEKFLRLPDKGAIAVVAASWRTSPASVLLSRAMMREFSHPGRIGDAFLRAKRSLEQADLVATYNLFGDPAAPLALPAATAQLSVSGVGAASRLTVTVGDAVAGGRAVIEFLDEDGAVVSSAEIEASSTHLEIPLPPDLAAAWARAYLWDPRTGTDAVGALQLRQRPAG